MSSFTPDDSPGTANLPEPCPAYLTASEDGAGLYDAFVQYHGSLCGVRLRDALSWSRHATGRTGGAVPFWNRHTRTWDGEHELNP